MISRGYRLIRTQALSAGPWHSYKRDYAEAYRALTTAKVTMTTLTLYGQTVAIPYLVGLTARAEGDVEKAKSAFLDARQAYIATLGDKADGINDLSAPLPAEIQATFPHYFRRCFLTWPLSMLRSVARNKRCAKPDVLWNCDQYLTTPLGDHRRPEFSLSLLLDRRTG